MRIAVGSPRIPQMEAVEEAWQIFGGHLIQYADEPLEFSSYDLSHVGHRTPQNSSEMMSNAQLRVEELTLQLKRERSEADYYIGMEAGFNVMNSQGPRRLVFLESWVYVSDGHQSFFGHGGGVPIPARLSSPVLDRGIELAIAIDRFSSHAELGSSQEIWGMLTRDYVTRHQTFVTALLAAFAPFYNPAAYR